MTSYAPDYPGFPISWLLDSDSWLLKRYPCYWRAASSAVPAAILELLVLLELLAYCFATGRDPL
jgi:hypothetical protein